MIAEHSSAVAIPSDHQRARDLLAKLYREIGIQAVCAELGLTVEDESETETCELPQAMPQHDELAA